MTNHTTPPIKGGVPLNAREIELRAYQYVGNLLLVGIYEAGIELAAAVMSREDWNNQGLVKDIVKTALRIGG